MSVFEDLFGSPLVCVCPVPLADPAVQFGQCRICFRKPVALFSPANQARLGYVAEMAVAS